MTTEPRTPVTNGTKKRDKSQPNSSCVVRIKKSTRAKLDAILGRINKKHPGKTKIRHDAVICYALTLLGDYHLDAIRNDALSNEDLFAMRFKAMSKGKSNMSWDDFLGLVMEGKVTFAGEGVDQH